MDMLKFRTLCHTIRNVHMIQLLAIHIKEIRVSLQLWDSGHLVQIFQAGLGDEVFLRCNVRKFVKVATGDDFGVFVLLQDFGDEVLKYVSLRDMDTEGKGKLTAARVVWA